MLYTVAALARRLGVPFRSGGSLSASKLPDAQAAYEIGGDAAADDPRRRQLRAPRRRVAGGRAGDRLREVRPRLRPARDDGDVRQGARPVSDNGQALDAIREQPARQCTSSARPTRWPTSRPRSTARARPTTRPSSSGSRRASLDAAQRANKLWKERLAAYEPPPIDDAIDEELREYVARRKAELPDSVRMMPRILWQHTRRPSSSFLPQKHEPDSAAAIRTTVVVMSATEFGGCVV